MTLGLIKAVPCGLIVNELVSNAYKYAFTNIEEGLINIQGRVVDDDHYMISVRDNGAGSVDSIDLEDPKTLGLQLVNMLVGQLSGSLKIIQHNGVEVIFKFPIAEERGGFS